MNSGKLRHTVTIQTPTETISGTGDVTLTWATYHTRRADVRAESGREYDQADHIEGVTAFRVKIRDCQGITPKMRLIWGSKTLNIDAVMPDPTNRRFVILRCLWRA